MSRNIVVQFTADYSGKFAVHGFMVTNPENYAKYLAFVQAKFVGTAPLVIPFGDGESLTVKDFAAFKALLAVTDVNHAEKEFLVRLFKVRLYGVLPYAAESGIK